MGEEELPVSESLKVIKGITLYKTENGGQPQCCQTPSEGDKSRLICGGNEGINGNEKTSSLSTTKLNSGE